MKYILRMGQGYVVSAHLTFDIPRFTFNPDEALELPGIVARALQAKSALPLILEEAAAERPDAGHLGRRGMKDQTLEQMRADWKVKNAAYHAANPRKQKARKKNQDWSEYCDIIRD